MQKTAAQISDETYAQAREQAERSPFAGSSIDARGLHHPDQLSTSEYAALVGRLLGMIGGASVGVGLGRGDPSWLTRIGRGTLGGLAGGALGSAAGSGIGQLVSGSKTASQIGDEVLSDLEKSAFKLPFKGKPKPQYVTSKELEESGKRIQSQLKPAQPKTESPTKAEGSMKMESIWKPFRKAASQIADEVLFKLAQGEQMDSSMYEDTPARKRHWPWGAGGALAGGLAGHYLLPSDITKGYRETAKGLEGASQAAQEAYKPYYSAENIKFQGVPEEIAKQHGVMVKDVGAAGKPVRFQAPANVARDYMKSRAWAESMPRTLGGAALGLGGGLLLSSMLS